MSTYPRTHTRNGETPMSKTTTSTHAPLTKATTLALAVIIEAAAREARVRRLTEDNEVTEGTARHLVTGSGTDWCTGDGDDGTDWSPGDGDDLRDCYLRVTTTGGWEAWWPVSELIELVHTGALAFR
jgi:hypothetical protein